MEEQADEQIGSRWDAIVSKEQSNACAYCLELIEGTPASAFFVPGATYHSWCLREAMLKAQERFVLGEVIE